MFKTYSIAVKYRMFETALCTDTKHMRVYLWHQTVTTANCNNKLDYVREKA